MTVNKEVILMLKLILDRKIRLCKYAECPKNKKVCCHDCLEQDICNDACWENPLECGSCIIEEKFKYGKE